MTSALYLLTKGCGADRPDVQNGEMNKTAKVFVATALADVASLIAIVILAILETAAIIAMPAAAYYTLVGIAACIVILHVLTAIDTKCGNLAPAYIIQDWCQQSCAKNNQSEKRQ